MAPSAWAVLLLIAPLLFGLAAAYPHRAYHDEADVQAPEKNVRHIDGLDASEARRQVEESVRRQVEEQVRATGSGKASGQWSVRKYSEYGGSGNGNAPIRASITGEALEGGNGAGVITTNCHNCRMTVRRVGDGSRLGAGHYSSSGSAQYSSGAGQYASGAGHYASGAEQGAGSLQSESSQSRYYSSSGSGGYGGVRPANLGAVGSSGRVVQSSRVEEASGYGFAQRPESFATDSTGSSSTGSSRSDSRVVTSQSRWNLGELGYATQDLQELIRRMDEDLRAGRFENGKTVTTVTTSTSENGGPPVTRQETFVKDGVDLAILPSDLGIGKTTTIGHSEVEDLLKTLRDELRSGKTQAGKTVTTVVESSSINGATPVVTKKTYVRDGFDLDIGGIDRHAANLDREASNFGAPGSRSVTKTTTSLWSSGADGAVVPLGGHRPAPFPGPVDHLGGGNLLTNAHKSSRNMTSVSAYSSTDGTGHETRAVDALGGGHLIRETGGYGAGSSTYGSSRRSEVKGYGGSSSSAYGAESSSTLKETRRVDALGGGHLIRESGTGYGGSDVKSTRRVDALGGGHLIRETGQSPLPTSESLSVSQMPGYRKDAPEGDNAPASAYGGNSKYYSTFQSSSYNAGGAGGAGGAAAVALDGSRQTSVDDADTVLSGADGVARTSSSSSSSYKKVVSYSSSGSADVLAERDVDHLGGGHLIRGVPSGPSSGSSSLDVQRTTDHGEQQNGRIPEATSGSYFSSSQQTVDSGVQQQLGTQRGGQLTTSLLDLGVLPAGSSSQGGSQQGSSGSSYSATNRYAATSGSGYGSSGSGYGARGYEAGVSGYGSGGNTYESTGSSGYTSGSSSRLSSQGARHYESSVSSAPASSRGAAWSSHSSYSSGTPSRASSSYGSSSSSDVRGSYSSGLREQRMTQGAQVHGGGDGCEQGRIKI